MRQRFLSALAPLLGLVLLVVAVAILRRELAAYHLHDILRHLHAIPAPHVALAMLFTVLGYGTLTGYDALALHYVRQPLPYRKIAFASFVAYVFSHNVGLSFFGGSAVRFRVYSSWGVRADDIARIVAFGILTFWLGVVALGGVVHTGWPLAVDLPGLHLASTRPLGLLLLGALLAWVATSALRREPLRVLGMSVRMPGPRMTAAQIAVSMADWLLAASVLRVLLPDAPGLGFASYVAAFVLAQVIGVVSHVPGGLGVFETAMVVLLKPWLPGDQVLGSAVAYRLVYYLMPLGAAVLAMTAFELRQRTPQLARAGAWLRGSTRAVVPRLFAVTTFLAGALLLLSGATPALPDRLAWLERLMPVPLLELSHLAGSIAGVLLLVLANALRRRLDGAWFATEALLVVGIVASLLKGLDWEEATILAAMGLLMAPCRSFFYRKSSLLSQPLTTGWWLAVGVVLLGSLLALQLAYRHVEYANELWWRFGFEAQAPRSLRALLAGGVVLLVVGVLRLLRAAPPVPKLPEGPELDRAQDITARTGQVEGYLALLGDKQLLFHEAGDAFLMFSVSGGSWVAMGDPIGAPERREELAWSFLELADTHGGQAVFYEVSDHTLPIYLDMGLALRKLGEEGIVSLPDFNLEGGGRRGLRQTCNRMARDGVHFEVVPTEAVPPLLDAVESVSEEWLRDKGTREKGFSLGSFDRDYLCRLPLALVRRGGELLAFANLWPSDTREVLSIDLMRYGTKAPPGVMEYLFTQLMLWGRAQGYRSYSLGMAPLAGFEHHRLAPLWNRVGSLLFRHGEDFYNFQGLHTFKEKFDPEWEPRYLAAPGGLAIPVVLTRIATLVSGGVGGVIAR